jgi:hypothetical protein
LASLLPQLRPSHHRLDETGKEKAELFARHALPVGLGHEIIESVRFVIVHLGFLIAVVAQFVVVPKTRVNVCSVACKTQGRLFAARGQFGVNRKPPAGTVRSSAADAFWPLR